MTQPPPSPSSQVLYEVQPPRPTAGISGEGFVPAFPEALTEQGGVE